jgi:NAD(P)-dependent dehydrogenase (short-subunit alcohol dehydrogenase family)
MEYAKEGIRFNAVAPGIVDTPMHAAGNSEFLKGLSPMGMISDVDDIVEAIAPLNVTGSDHGESGLLFSRGQTLVTIGSILSNNGIRLPATGHPSSPGMAGWRQGGS